MQTKLNNILLCGGALAWAVSLNAAYIGPGDGGTTTGYIGQQYTMNSDDAGVAGDKHLTFNVYQGSFGTWSGNETILFANEHFHINELTITGGFSSNQIWFTGTGHGSGDIHIQNARQQDFVFTGNMQDFSGRIIIDLDQNYSNAGSLQLGDSNSSVIQFGGTHAGGTEAQGEITTDAHGRRIDNVAGTGDFVVNNLVFNYSASEAYEYLHLTNNITQRVSINFTGSADILASGTLSGSGTLRKSGAGTLTLTGANTYSGDTTISEGKLVAGHASALGTGTVNAMGGILATTVANVNIGALNITHGTLVINGDAAGNLTLQPGRNFVMSGGLWNINLATGIDRIIGSAGGTFAITGGTIDLGGGAIDYSKSYDLICGFASGSVSDITITGYDTANWQAGLDSTGVLSFTAIPEPSTYGLIGAGTLAAIAFVRRRRRFAGLAAG